MTQVFQHDARKGRLRAVLPSLLMVQPVVAWAAFGAAVFIFSLTVFGRWLVSPEFSPVPVVNNDGFDAPAVLMLRMFEALSLSVAASALGHYLLRPLLLRRPVPIEGLLLAAPLVTYVFDTTVNYNDYFMAWNAHSINAGTWANYFPGHHGPTRYAEGLAWGPPMYLYFGIALANVQLFLIARFADLVGRIPVLLFAFAAAFAVDFAAESAIIYFTRAYAWPYTIGALTLWRGSPYQFPLYEALIVAVYASLYAWLIACARRDGRAPIEVGLAEVPVKAHSIVRFLAAIGFSAACTIVYFTGFGLLALAADTRVQLPNYMEPADNWGSGPKSISSAASINSVSERRSRN